MISSKEILDCPISENLVAYDDAKTIGDFFKICMINLWEKGESFNGKRPLGDSGWDYDLILSLGYAGIIEPDSTEILDDGSKEIDMSDDKINKGRKMIMNALREVNYV